MGASNVAELGGEAWVGSTLTALPCLPRTFVPGITQLLIIFLAQAPRFYKHCCPFKPGCSAPISHDFSPT